MNKITLIIVFIIFLVLSVSSTGAAYYYYRQNQVIRKNPQAATEMDNQAILKKIGAIMELPPEKPSIATILDREKLKDQAFFQKAQNGDKVIIFEQARRVLLYRPDTGRVIDFAPLILDAQPSTSSSTTVTPNVTNKATLTPTQAPQKTATKEAQPNFK